MKNVMISPAEVIALAFKDGGYVSEDVVSDADIANAVSRWIEPVAGSDLCRAVAAGDYPEARDYFAEAAAAATRLEIQPRLNAATGQGGLTQASSIFAVAAAESARIELMRSLRLQVSISLRRLTEYLDENAESIPEYDPRNNVLKRCVTDGGFVQIL